MEAESYTGVKRFSTAQIIEGIQLNDENVIGWIQATYVPIVEQYLTGLKWRVSDASNVFARTLDKVKHQIKFKKNIAGRSFKTIFEDRMRMAWMDTISGYMAEALISGDSKIIQQFDQIIRPVVWSMVKKYRQNTDSGEEVYSEAFWRVMENIKAGKYTENGTFKSYFLSIVTNILREGGRHKSKQVDYDDYFENNDPIDNDDYEFYQAHEEKLKRLEELLSQADEQCAHIFKLYYWQAYKIQEIANMLEITLNNAKKRLSRCRKKLKSAF